MLWNQDQEPGSRISIGLHADLDQGEKIIKKIDALKKIFNNCEEPQDEKLLKVLSLQPRLHLCDPSDISGL